MKKLALILSILFFQMNISAQSIFDKYEDFDDVSSIVATDEMFKLLKEIQPESAEAKDEISVLSELTGLKVFSTENEKIGLEMKKDADSYIQQKNMSELLRINDNGAKIKFYIIKSTEAHKAKELIMFLTKKENDKTKTVVMLVTGDIDLKKLSKLNKKVKMIDVKYLKEVEENEQKKG